MWTVVHQEDVKNCPHNVSVYGPFSFQEDALWFIRRFRGGGDCYFVEMEDPPLPIDTEPNDLWLSKFNNVWKVIRVGNTTLGLRHIVGPK
jgi:hypothetical protein